MADLEFVLTTSELALSILSCRLDLHTHMSLDVVYMEQDEYFLSRLVGWFYTRILLDVLPPFLNTCLFRDFK